MSADLFQHSGNDNRVTLFADVILPVPIPRMFTYRVPFEMNDLAQQGSRVIVQFGKRKILTGVIGKVHETPPVEYEAKYILDILDHEPTVGHHQLELYRWIADYYMCTIGEVLNVALPTGLKLTSESRIALHPGFDKDISDYEYAEKESLILDQLEGDRSLSYSEVARLLGQKSIHAIIKSLVHKEAVIIYEEVQERYKPRIQKRIRLSPGLVNNEPALKQAFDDLERYSGQLDILMYYLQVTNVLEDPAKNEEGMPKSGISKERFSPSSLKTLIRNGILEEYEVEVSRLEEFDTRNQKVTLTDDQTEAWKSIHEYFKEQKPVMLYGVTGSGKTETYIQVIQEALESGVQVLYLLPEIALTTQIVNRLRKIFGDEMGVYHSRFSDNERVEVWKRLQSGDISFIVGVRSSIFLPFDNLGLIIVDEEHEPSYKQYDPAPRYNARDAALYMSRLHGARILLGSATPSLESWYNARTGKYGLVTLESRYGDSIMPEFITVDTARERKKKLMVNEFSSVLRHEIEETLHHHKQSIIFQNRRGYAPYLSCNECQWIPKCRHCSVSLTYHMYSNDLRCHYCGYKQKIPLTCEACGSDDLKPVSHGTEKLEETLRSMFASARIQRMDLDTTRSKKSYQQILDAFEHQEIDILVGTQMVSKGLDFDHVSLVGVFDTDRMMHFPDFRSSERTFQLITQVSGRAGRREEQGKVVIQTSYPDNPLIQRIIRHDYTGFAEAELRERKDFRYPPYVRLISITVRHENRDQCRKSALYLSLRLTQQLGNRMVIGPEEPVISRIRNQYIQQILLKIDRKALSLAKIKDYLKLEALKLLKDTTHKGTSIIFDVDPV